MKYTENEKYMRNMLRDIQENNKRNTTRDAHKDSKEKCDIRCKKEMR